MGKNIGKKISCKYNKKLLDSAKKSTADAVKVSSKRAMQKTAETTGALIGNKTSDKITKASNVYSMELHSKVADNEILKERYISPEERLQIIDELRLT